MILHKYDEGHYPIDELEQENNWQIYIQLLHNMLYTKHEIIACCIIEEVDIWQEQVEKFYKNKSK